MRGQLFCYTQCTLFFLLDIAVPVVVFVISVLLGTVLAVICVTSGGCCCCRSRKTHNIRLIR